MIILGKIQQVTPQTMKDKATGKESVMHLVVITDATKPGVFRTSTPFCMFLGDDKLKQKLGAGDLTDEPVTLVAKEVAPYNAFLKVKGEIVQGHQSGEQLLKMQIVPDASTAAQTPPPGPLGQPSKPAGK